MATKLLRRLGGGAILGELVSCAENALHMDFYDYATTHDLTRKAGLTSETPAVFYRQLQAAAYVERARGVQGIAVDRSRYSSELFSSRTLQLAANLFAWPLWPKYTADLGNAEDCSYCTVPIHSQDCNGHRKVPCHERRSTVCPFANR